ncbi:hypothetical protein QOT17_009170 [Balamuthia mandrillaris]
MSREYSLLISTAKSMLEMDGHNGRSRWEEAKEAALAFADICCDFDTDGLVDVFFYGEEEETSRPFQVTSAEELKQQFDVKPTAKKSFVTKCLQRAIDNFPLTDMHTIIVITDGQVNDQEKLIALIKDTAQQLENDESELLLFLILSVSADLISHSAGGIKRISADNFY